MSENKDNKTEKKPLKLSKKLELNKTSTTDRGSRSGGGRTVVVEVKRRNRSATKISESNTQMRVSDVPPSIKKPDSSETEAKKELKPQSAKKPHGLSEAERKARLDAVARASKFMQKKEILQQESQKRVEELKRLQQEERRRANELEEEFRRKQEEKIKQEKAQKESEQQQTDTESEIVDPTLNPEDVKPVTKHVLKTVHKSTLDDEIEKTSKPEVKKLGAGRRDGSRRSGKITVTQALSDDGDRERGRSLSAIRRAREKEKKKMQEQFAPREKISREVIIPDVITVQELAQRMAEQVSEVVKLLMKNGIMATATQSIDTDTAQLVAEELGHKVKRISESDVEDYLLNIKDDAKDLISRAPVVTVMGHVDHGKTSLLDALRSTDVVAGEAGGITQHIGAYQVTMQSGDKITFVDTPGHAAFTEMRARGANVTDIVVLVIAADDGIKEQTVEAINHAKAAKVPIVVAINKIDKPDADPKKARNELLMHELVPEEMGGDIMCVEVSAKNKLNLDKLEEAILLQAEVLELKANPNTTASGVVVEAKLEKGRGPVATTLIQRGTLRKGDIFVAGTEFGRVRTLISDHGTTIDSAGPSVPVEVVGFDGTPHAGDIFTVVEDEAKAREITEYRQRKKREKENLLRNKSRMEQLFSGNEEHRELPVLIKADVQGSAEAIVASLEKLSTDEVKVKVLHMGVGGINETDMSLANASNALVIGFNVRANNQARDFAMKEKIEVRYYSIIYDVINDVKALMSGLLAPTIQEEFLGRAEIRKVFKISSVGTIAGCYVQEGVVKRGSKVRILRDDVVIHEGKLKSLKRMKDEIREVKTNFECGMAFESYNDLREGDIIECSEEKEIERTL
jgi:translation initiation factor IF-2